MDALRKAEEAKRAASGDGLSADAGARVAPDAQAAYSDTSLATGIPAELALEPLAREIAAESATDGRPNPRPAASANATQQAQRDTINNAFAAKSAVKDPADRAFMVALVCVASLGLLGIGFYVWWQMQPRSALAPMPSAHAPAPAAPLAPQAPTQTPVAQAESLSEPAASTQITPAAPLTAVANALSGMVSADRPARTTPAEPTSPIRVTRSQTRINPLLEQGYAALQQGNLVQAQQAYARMLDSDPRNVDALYGLAAIAVQRQQAPLAEDYYLRILEADPRDAIAHAGLAGLKGKSGGAESRIKTLIAEQPNVPQLHFALGNVYAQEQRWRDAQQAYFLAYRNDSENPDAAFNLAVSLDQLHQDRQAAQYYGEALRLAAARPATFNREQVQARLRELQVQGGSQ